MILITLLQHAAEATAQANCNGIAGCGDTGLPKIAASQDNLRTLLQVVFGILAVVAVLVIAAWGGLKMITDSTNPQEITKARNTIVYAVVGLVIALSGEAIVTFFLNRL